MRRPAATTFFARRVLDYIVRHSGGVPRRINAFCHNPCCSPTRMASSRSRWRWPKMRLLITRASAALPVHHSTRHGFPIGLRSFSPMLGLGLLGVAGFVSGHALLNRHPLCHLRSMVKDTTLAQTHRAAAATIDPAMVNCDRSRNGKCFFRSRTCADRCPGRRLTHRSRPRRRRIVPAEALASAGHRWRSPSASVIVVRGDTLGNIALRYTGIGAGGEHAAAAQPAHR